MTTTLSDVMAEFSEEDRKDIRKRSRAHIKAVEDARKLDEIRRAVKMSQGAIASAMGIGQNAVSQLEKRRDVQLSTLSRYVESMGFQLELAIVSRSGERVSLKNFKPWQDTTAPIAKAARVAKAPAGSSRLKLG